MEQKQGFVPNATTKEGIGNIDFVWGDSGKGLQHIIERRNSQGYNGEIFVKELPEMFDNGKAYSKSNHPGRYYIGNKNKEATIRTDYNKKNRNWLTSAYYLEGVPKQASAGFRTSDRTLADEQFFPSSDLLGNKNIVTPSQNNLNPPQPQTPQPQTPQPQAPQKLSSFDEWLEELKCKRKQIGIF